MIFLTSILLGLYKSFVKYVCRIIRKLNAYCLGCFLLKIRFLFFLLIFTFSCCFCSIVLCQQRFSQLSLQKELSSEKQGILRTIAPATTIARLHIAHTLAVQLLRTKNKIPIKKPLEEFTLKRFELNTKESKEEQLQRYQDSRSNLCYTCKIENSASKQVQQYDFLFSTEENLLDIPYCSITFSDNNGNLAGYSLLNDTELNLAAQVLYRLVSYFDTTHISNNHPLILDILRYGYHHYDSADTDPVILAKFLSTNSAFSETWPQWCKKNACWVFPILSSVLSFILYRAQFISGRCAIALGICTALIGPYITYRFLNSIQGRLYINKLWKHTTALNSFSPFLEKFPEFPDLRSCTSVEQVIQLNKFPIIEEIIEELEKQEELAKPEWLSTSDISSTEPIQEKKEESSSSHTASAPKKQRRSLLRTTKNDRKKMRDEKKTKEEKEQKEKETEASHSIKTTRLKTIGNHLMDNLNKTVGGYNKNQKGKEKEPQKTTVQEEKLD